MPWAPRKPCNFPGCGALTDSGRCEQHKRQERRQYDEHRKDDPFHKFYSSTAWRQCREAFLSAHPLCSGDHGGRIVAATDVHHVVELRDGGDPFDWENLSGLCHEHHSRETAESGTRWGRKRGSR